MAIFHSKKNMNVEDLDAGNHSYLTLPFFAAKCKGVFSSLFRESIQASFCSNACRDLVAKRVSLYYYYMFQFVHLPMSYLSV